ncbi:endo alpha-1,4 polygalactosaminidase [Microbulbifer sp. 2205BS26-8]|uniref:endo alpha-1,4 polygalactosaminidase n=1 Tax=Microbulbifer sp. 2205BS26-8 TaxID=3064386 RepID=UPI00273FEF3F|nr:endo alpha-1,4 polygalactosaminidase [Microbulbifer sp. 2205BS26-8]MDP5211130.1 endo alpha-1,4 polygalactosaminidase [Microbulbifer sp. 2205BS26-8]
MRRILPFLVSPLLLLSCSLDDLPELVIPVNVDYDQEMRELVENISSYAKNMNRDFIVIPQNGIELVTTTNTTTGPVDTGYLDAIDGIAQEGVFFGFVRVDQRTRTSESQRLQTYLDLAKENNNAVLVTDFASSNQNINRSYEDNQGAGYISFAANQTTLDNIPSYPPEPFNVNSRDIDNLDAAGNFLNLTNTSGYSTPQEFVDALSETNFDLLIIDFFFNREPYTEEQIDQLKVKRNGSPRRLLAYVNIGKAQDNRYYWESFWPINPPSWLLKAVPGEQDNYYVEYWKEGWQDIIYGNTDSYIYRIVNAGFDGAYMDSIDVFEYFDSLSTVEADQ